MDFYRLIKFIARGHLFLKSCRHLKNIESVVISINVVVLYDNERDTEENCPLEIRFLSNQTQLNGQNPSSVL